MRANGGSATGSRADERIPISRTSQRERPYHNSKI